MKSIFFPLSFILFLISCNAGNVKFDEFGEIEMEKCLFESNKEIHAITDSIRIVNKSNNLYGLEGCHMNREEELISRLEKVDLLFTKKPVSSISSNTKKTKNDGCQYWMTIVEVTLESEITDNLIYVYELSSKNEYRVVSCP